MPSETATTAQAAYPSRLNAFVSGLWRIVRSIHLPLSDPFAMIGIIIYLV